MSDFAWETPTDAHFDGLLQRLRERPGEWARLKVYKNAKVSSASASQLRVRCDDEYEFTSRKMPDGTGVLYGRFVMNGVPS